MIESGPPEVVAEAAAVVEANVPVETQAAVSAPKACAIDVGKLNYMRLKRHMKDNGFSDAEVNGAAGKPTLLHMWNSREQ